MASRIHREVYVRFGGERLETYRRNAARRWALTLLFTAISPIPFSSFAGETTSNIGKNFLRAYAGVCLEGVIIALACVIFTVMASSPPLVNPGVADVTAVWSYIMEVIFNLLVLVGAVRMSDRIVKELLGL